VSSKPACQARPLLSLLSSSSKFLVSQTTLNTTQNTSSIPFCSTRIHHVGFHARQTPANSTSVCLLRRLSGCLYLCITRSQIPKTPTDHQHAIPILRSSRYCTFKKRNKTMPKLSLGMDITRSHNVPACPKMTNPIPSSSYRHCISILLDHHPKVSLSLLRRGDPFETTVKLNTVKYNSALETLQNKRSNINSVEMRKRFTNKSFDDLLAGDLFLSGRRNQEKYSYGVHPCCCCVYPLMKDS
jgi:hypothetical protein